MTVQELIEKLKDFPSEMEVVIEDSGYGSFTCIGEVKESKMKGSDAFSVGVPDDTTVVIIW